MFLLLSVVCPGGAAVCSIMGSQLVCTVAVGCLGDESEEQCFIFNPLYPDGYNYAAGVRFPIHGEGFVEGDIVTLTQMQDGMCTDITFSAQATLTDQGAYILIPCDFISGDYSVSVSRAASRQVLGTAKMHMVDSLREPAKTVAHRGWWTKDEGTCENSCASLRNALQGAFYCSETDVYITTDGHLIINHDDTRSGIKLAASTYDQVKDLTLSNGEKLPQLSDFIDIMRNEYPDSPTKLIIELKQGTPDLANAAVQAVHNAGIQDRVEYISFHLNACKYVRQADPAAVVSYLATTEVSTVKQNDLQGLDFNYRSFLNEPSLISQAHEQGLFVDVWTVNDVSTMLRLNSMGVDFITTNYPDQAQRIIQWYQEITATDAAVSLGVN